MTMRNVAAVVRVHFVFMAFVFAAVPFGCGAEGLDAPAQAPIAQAAVAGPLREVDMLFMVDNSGSMKEEQAKLRRNFPALIDSLRALPGGMPDLHLGIVSSDVGAGNITVPANPACNRPGGDRGRFQVKPGCGLDVTGGTFLVSKNNETLKNFTGALEDVFSCLADLGDKGCGFEHQLQAIRVALSPTITPENSNFLRRDALLVIVMLTDEDDCSGAADSDLFSDQSFDGHQGSLRCNIGGHLCNGAPPPGMPFTTALANCTAAPRGRLIPVNEFARFMFELKKNFPERIIVSAITGLPTPGKAASYEFAKTAAPGGELLEVQPVCSSGATGTAAPSLRTTEFVKAFGANGTLESICEDDFKPAFGRLGALIAARLENPSPPTGGAGAGGAGGMGGTGGMASKTDAGALGSDGAAAGGPGGTGSGGGDGGGCRLGSRAAQPSFWAGLVVAGAVVQSLRRRRRG